MLHNEYEDLSKANSSNLLVVNNYDFNRKNNENSNDLKVSNKIIDQISNERESPQAYDPPKLENIAATKFSCKYFGPLRQKVIK